LHTIGKIHRHPAGTAGSAVFPANHYEVYEPAAGTVFYIEHSGYNRGTINEKSKIPSKKETPRISPGCQTSDTIAGAVTDGNIRYTR